MRCAVRMIAPVVKVAEDVEEMVEDQKQTATHAEATARRARWNLFGHDSS